MVIPATLFISQNNTCALQYQSTVIFFQQEEQYGLPLTKMVEDAVGKYSVSTSSAINFGCGAGLTAFLLSKTFETVSTVDNYNSFVKVMLLRNGS